MHLLAPKVKVHHVLDEYRKTEFSASILLTAPPVASAKWYSRAWRSLCAVLVPLSSRYLIVRPLHPPAAGCPTAAQRDSPFVALSSMKGKAVRGLRRRRFTAVERG